MTKLLLHLAAHQGSHHAKEGSLNCDACTKSFVTPNNSKIHRSQCGAKKSTSGTAAGHSASQKTFACSQCGKHVHDLDQHFKHAHEEVEEVLLSAVMNELNPKQSAVDMIQEDKRISCNYCTKTFTSKYNFKQHLQRFHPDKVEKNSLNEASKKSHACTVCGKKFQGTPSRLSRHMREVHAENRFECQVCGHFFPVRASLERHLQTVHRPVKLECPFCPVVVVHLSAHLMSAHNLAAVDARAMAAEFAGKFSARTSMTAEIVVSRRSEK